MKSYDFIIIITLLMWSVKHFLSLKWHTVYVKFTERLKDLRKDRNLSTRQLAKAIGVGYASISRWETGKAEPVLSQIYKLCDYFEVSADYLLGRTDY